MSEFNVDDILAEFRDGKRKKPAPAESTPTPKTTKSIGATDIIKSIDASKKEAPQTPASKAPAAPKNNAVATTNEEYDEYKPTEPLFSIEQLRKIEAQRKESFKAQSEAPAQKAPEVKAEKPAPVVEKPAPVVDKPAIREEKPIIKTEKSTDKKASPTPARKPEAAAKKPATIFGDIDQEEKKPKKKKDKANVSINTNPFTSFSEKIAQHKFLFEELVKRDFKKKYKRTILGMLWSVVSPLLSFLVQFIVFGALFRRNDSNFVIYLLTGNLMFHYFSDSTNTGMFSIYRNAGVISKIKVPKSIFVLSSTVASIFNFLLTMLVYFVFMFACRVNFGPHLILMIYPIICMSIFNIGIIYILSSLFVFFRDTQYLYSIVIKLLSYVSAIFYYADSMPDSIQIVFAVNPIYRYISYMRQLVIDSVIPSATSHLVCAGFAIAALILGYLFYKKTEKNFVYYY